MANLKEKILDCGQNFGLTKTEMASKLGISKSNFVGDSMKSDPSGDILVRFCREFPEVSAEWLLRDEGRMIRSTHQETNVNNGVNIGHIGSSVTEETTPEQDQPGQKSCDPDYCRLLKTMQDTIDAQKVTIDTLRKK